MGPGPIVGELNSVGIPAKIMGGSVHIQKQTVVLKEGEVFEGDLGMMLGKIGINPIVTGLRLIGTYEEGVVFRPDVLDIDFDAFRSDLIGFAAGAFNVACHVGWFTPETTPTLLAKASSEALAVALEVAHISTTTLPHLLGRAHRAAMGVAGSLDSSALDDELAAMLGLQLTLLPPRPLSPRAPKPPQPRRSRKRKRKKRKPVSAALETCSAEQPKHMR